jgi:hypothetical protein
MKLTESKLRDIIQEELSKLNEVSDEIEYASSGSLYSGDRVAIIKEPYNSTFYKIPEDMEKRDLRRELDNDKRVDAIARIE